MIRIYIYKIKNIDINHTKTDTGVNIALGRIKIKAWDINNCKSADGAFANKKLQVKDCFPKHRTLLNRPPPTAPPRPTADGPRRPGWWFFEAPRPYGSGGRLTKSSILLSNAKGVDIICIAPFGLLALVRLRSTVNWVVWGQPYR